MCSEVVLNNARVPECVYLRLFLLDELQHLVRQSVVFGPSVCEDVDEGAGQGDLQCYLYGPDAHLGTVSASLFITRVNYQRLQHTSARLHI